MLLFRRIWLGGAVAAAIFQGIAPAGAGVVVDTGQVRCYDQSRAIPCPSPGGRFYGQDGNYQGVQPAYRDNGNGTVSDLNTGLTWSKAVDGRKLTLEEAQEIARAMRLGGHSDWRVPSIKELYSLMDFRGYTGFSPRQRGFDSGVPDNAVPFINIDFFDFQYGNTQGGERFIDAQWLSGTRYVATTMGGAQTLFGVNFADGRIKGYGVSQPHSRRILKRFFARYVRGPEYGRNQFRDNGDGTVTDLSSDLTWTRKDSGRGMNWEQALRHAETFELAGFDDWRLPNAKELQYLVDYTRSPDTTDSAALDPLFEATPIQNEAGVRDFPYYWTSTTHQDGPNPGSDAVYIAFGRAIGMMHDTVMDVHGAGAQRGDPKTGPAQIGHGPQGDARRVENYVRLVRGGNVTSRVIQPESAADRYPDNARSVHDVGQEATTGTGGGMEGGFGPGMDGGGPGMGGPGMDNGGPGMGGPGMGGRGSGGGAGFVKRLDQDGDGRVSRQEFDGPPRMFDHHDTNRDSFLSDDEAPPFPPPR